MINQKSKILVVEDDKPIRNLITTTLETQDYKYIVAENGASAILAATSHNPDIILLDLGLPDMDGVEVIKKVRSWSMLPIIVISARSEDDDKIKALDAGADDYLTKPFSVAELLARLRTTYRRLQHINGLIEDTNQSYFINGDLKIDYPTATVTVRDQEIHLMPIEYSLICLLAKNIGKVLTHRFILDHVWSNAIESDKSSLRVYMASLRKKLGTGDNTEQYIQTHVGIGYRMVKMENPK
ncbi:response regulator [Anaerosporobacter sp.]